MAGLAEGIDYSVDLIYSDCNSIYNTMMHKALSTFILFFYLVFWGKKINFCQYLSYKLFSTFLVMCILDEHIYNLLS